MREASLALALLAVGMDGLAGEEGTTRAGALGAGGTPGESGPGARTRPGLVSFKGAWLQIGGELELELVDTQAEDRLGGTADPETRFQLDKLSLYPRVTIAEGLSLKGDIEFSASGAKVERGYLKAEGLPFGMWLKVGLDKRFIDTSRKTETYPLTGTAFWRDKQAGIACGGEARGLSWTLSFTDGCALSDKPVAEDESFEIIHDDALGAPEKQEIGAGLGWRHESRAGRFSLLGFYFADSVSDADYAFLSGIPGYTGDASDDEQHRLGGRLVWTLGGWTAACEYVQARDGTLDRRGWYAQLSHRWKLPGRERLTSVEPIARYNELDVDLPHDSGSSLTWDRRMLTVGALVGLASGTTLKVEYNFNREETGAGSVHNDELLLHLEVKF